MSTESFHHAALRFALVSSATALLFWLTTGHDLTYEVYHGDVLVDEEPFSSLGRFLSTGLVAGAIGCLDLVRIGFACQSSRGGCFHAA